MDTPEMNERSEIDTDGFTESQCAVIGRAGIVIPM